jgi:signal transduction histidine kinase
MQNSARTRANRENAKKSTGPRTAAGKTAVAVNARQHGLSGSFNILAHEDRVEFHALLDQYRAEFKPRSADEGFLVEQMAQSRWTLARARRIESHLLDQLAGAPLKANEPDARIAAELIARSGAALATVQRYATTAERAYFRARRELLQARSSELRNKANEAQLWLKGEMQQLAGETPALPFDPDNPDPAFFSLPPRHSSRPGNVPFVDLGS